MSKEHINQRRADILEAAKQVFCKKGFEPTTMKDVVDASGMSRGGVYQYFPNTEEMMRAILEDGMIEFNHHLSNLLSRHEQVWHAINEYIDLHKNAPSDHFGIVTYEYFVTCWRNHERRNYLQHRYSFGINYFIQFIQTGVDRGQFKPLQPVSVIAKFMMNVLDGLLLEQSLVNLNDQEKEDQYDALRFYLRTVLQINDKRMQKE